MHDTVHTDTPDRKVPPPRRLQRIRRGSFHSIVDLQAAIKRYMAEHNAEPKPFVWKASAASILAKLDRLPAPSV
jgi:hypothetical protein